MARVERTATVWTELRRTAGGYWSGLAPRERAWSGGALVVLAIGLLWALALAPALRTLQRSEALQRQLDTQWPQMQRLQTEAQALQARRQFTRDEALRALESSVKSTLGATAELNTSGDRVTLTLKNTPAPALALWLTQARINAHVVPAEARLQRSAAPEGGAPKASIHQPLSTMPSIGAMPAMGSMPMGVMPGAGIPTGAAPPPSETMRVMSPTEPRTSAAWSGTLLLHLP